MCVRSRMEFLRSRTHVAVPLLHVFRFCMSLLVESGWQDPSSEICLGREKIPAPACKRTCSKEVAGVEQVTSIPRRLQYMVVTSYMQVRTRLTVAHSPVTRRGPCRASFRSLPLYTLKRTWIEEVDDLPLPYSVILLLLHIRSCRLPLSPHAVTCTAAGSYSSSGKSWLFYAVHIHYCGVMQFVVCVGPMRRQESSRSIQSG